ncbi:MAG: hypothetical protein JW881_13045 [Spirochaetales bacterium]|nr:hypothetical protein [Spirochaetales bacterium]
MKKMSRQLCIVSCIAAGVLFLLHGCGSRYNFDHDPPYINARMNEVFPGSIKNSHRTEYNLPLPENYIGYEVTYLDGAIVMIVIKAPDENGAAKYFDQAVLPAFAMMHEHHYGEDGKWRYVTGKEKDGRHWIGWYNGIWVFELNGLTEEYFDLVIRASRFISRKE